MRIHSWKICVLVALIGISFLHAARNIIIREEQEDMYELPTTGLIDSRNNAETISLDENDRSKPLSKRIYYFCKSEAMINIMIGFLIIIAIGITTFYVYNMASKNNSNILKPILNASETINSTETDSFLTTISPTYQPTTMLTNDTTFTPTPAFTTEQPMDENTTEYFTTYYSAEESTTIPSTTQYIDKHINTSSTTIASKISEESTSTTHGKLYKTISKPAIKEEVQKKKSPLDLYLTPNTM
ncbi:hypothetical protein NEFER03_1180 [Nematocida sp. LUAm3]|nr:hypothetical protein NEFER03_1180 [Nematocida sp. LUAm3]KAI5175789.1 hypothetical protein NEFER02_1658 [Nematocida sp. LUAm2]KAI5178285.1 hypothetical protein NEFER01_1452 [Nematocida sp. LUAm1]